MTLLNRKKYRRGLPSFIEDETEFESLESVVPIVPIDIRTTYATQEMPTGSCSKPNSIIDTESDFYDHGSD